MIPKDERCQERIISVSGFHDYQCRNRHVVVRDGKLYCRMHDPIERKRKADERSKAWDEKYERDRSKREAMYTKVNCHDDLVAALKAALPAMESAWYELDPGMSTLGHQFICQGDMDKRIAIVKAALAKVEGGR